MVKKIIPLAVGSIKENKIFVVLLFRTNSVWANHQDESQGCDISQRTLARVHPWPADGNAWGLSGGDYGTSYRK